jgi:hypothetical protein
MGKRRRLIAKTISWRAELSEDGKSIMLARYDMQTELHLAVAEAGEFLELVKSSNVALAVKSDSSLDEALFQKASDF